MELAEVESSQVESIIVYLFSSSERHASLFDGQRFISRRPTRADILEKIREKISMFALDKDPLSVGKVEAPLGL